MKFLIKLAALAMLAVVLAGIFAADTDVGRVANAAIDDVMGFCERQPDACRQGAALAQSATRFVVRTAQAFAGDSALALTEEDRALAPPDPAAGAQHQALATHGEPLRP